MTQEGEEKPNNLVVTPKDRKPGTWAVSVNETYVGKAVKIEEGDDPDFKVGMYRAMVGKDLPNVATVMSVYESPAGYHIIRQERLSDINEYPYTGDVSDYKAVAADIIGAVKQINSVGFVILDIHYENFGYDPNTGKLKLFDLGGGIRIQDNPSEVFPDSIIRRSFYVEPLFNEAKGDVSLEVIIKAQTFSLATNLCQFYITILLAKSEEEVSEVGKRINNWEERFDREYELPDSFYAPEGKFGEIYKRIPRRLKGVFDKALSIDPEKRYPDLDSFIKAFQEGSK